MPTGKQGLTQVAFRCKSQRVRDGILQDKRFMQDAKLFGYQGAGLTSIHLDASGMKVDKTVAVEAIVMNKALFKDTNRVAILGIDGTAIPSTDNDEDGSLKNHLGLSKACGSILALIRNNGMVVFNTGNKAVLQMQRILPCLHSDLDLVDGVFLVAQAGTVAYRFQKTDGGASGAVVIAQRISEWTKLSRSVASLHAAQKVKEELLATPLLPFVADSDWKGARSRALAQIQVYVGRPLDNSGGPVIVDDPYRRKLPALMTATASTDGGTGGGPQKWYQDAGLEASLSLFADLDEDLLLCPGGCKDYTTITDKQMKALEIIMDEMLLPAHEIEQAKIANELEDRVVAEEILQMSKTTTPSSKEVSTNAPTIKPTPMGSTAQSVDSAEAPNDAPTTKPVESVTKPPQSIGGSTTEPEVIQMITAKEDDGLPPARKDSHDASSIKVAVGQKGGIQKQAGDDGSQKSSASCYSRALGLVAVCISRLVMS